MGRPCSGRRQRRRGGITIVDPSCLSIGFPSLGGGGGVEMESDVVSMVRAKRHNNNITHA